LLSLGAGVLRVLGYVETNALLDCREPLAAAPPLVFFCAPLPAVVDTESLDDLATERSRFRLFFFIDVVEPPDAFPWAVLLPPVLLLPLFVPRSSPLSLPEDDEEEEDDDDDEEEDDDELLLRSSSPSSSSSSW